MAKQDDASEGAVGTLEAENETQRLNLDVQVQSPTACERHIVVTIPRDDINRYYDRAFTDLMPKATVPGFREGRAPRKLVEARFKKDMGDQVKGSLLMDSMAQVTEDSKLSAISEPDFDPVAIKLPDDGPMTFEFDIEVRPEFTLPDWKGLKIERPTRTFTDADYARRAEEILGQFGRLVPFDGAASAGDYVTVNLRFKNGDEVVSESNEEVIRIRPTLSFRDGKVEKFDKLMIGVKADETRSGEAKLSNDAPNEGLRGKTVTAEFKVLEVKKLALPEKTTELFTGIGFDNEEAFMAAIKTDMQRQLEYFQQQRTRQQITGLLTESASWELPPGLLRRQSRRELERAVLELRRNGFPESQIRQYENELRQNSMVNTARALKEHFILERIAEEESIEAEEHDYTLEIALIAGQSGESSRRIRARLEKGGMMDALRNQIIERKVIKLVTDAATFKDVPYELNKDDVEAIEQSAGGDEADVEIPDAKYEEGAPNPLDPNNKKENVVTSPRSLN